jgi:hypothetical protein
MRLVAEPTCGRCGRLIDKGRATFLHLNCKTGLYSEDEELPEDEDQGWFSFGQACAKKVLANGGRNWQGRRK